MRVISVDGDERALETTLALVAGLPGVSETRGFTTGRDALDWVGANGADLALLDVCLPEEDGMALARELRARWPDMSVVFLTARAQCALDAFSLHADGFLPKPVSPERLAEEIAFALPAAGRRERKRAEVRTFGRFDVLVNGRPVLFRLSRAKELLAYLVDKAGSGVTRAEAFAVLWEDRQYDRSMQKQLDAIIRSLRSSLEEYGIGSILSMESGWMRICPGELDCDLYRFCRGDTDALREFHGEYMRGYAWAELTEGYMVRKMSDREGKGLAVVK